MSLVQPIIKPISAFDAKEDKIFEFVVNSGNQVISNRLVIKDNETNAEIYNKQIESYKLEHLVPANTLTNGKYYNCYIITYDINGNSSPQSNIIAFRCYDKPVITFLNIPEDGIIESTNFTINANYSQEQNELLDFAKFILYDENDNVLFESENIYNSNIPPFTLSYTFNGLENDSNFKVSIKCITLNGTIFETEKQSFRTRYFSPSMYTLIELENICEEGYVKIKSNFKLVDYISNPEDINQNIEDGKLSLLENGEYVKYYRGFNIENNFTLKFFINNPNNGKIAILGETEKIEISIIEDYPYGEEIKKKCAELICYDKNGMSYYIYSNFINNDNNLLLWVRKINNIFEIRLEELS